MSKLISKFIHSKEPKQNKPITEGIGVGIVKASPSTWTVLFLSFFVSALTWHYVLLYWLGRSIAKTTVAYFSSAKALEMFSDIKMHKYIEKKCHELYVEAKKQYPDLIEYPSKQCDKSQIQAAKRTAGALKTMTNAVFINTDLKQYKHTVVMFCDTTSVDSLYAIFELPKAKTFICALIQPPTEEDIKKMGFKKG